MKLIRKHKKMESKDRRLLRRNLSSFDSRSEKTKQSISDEIKDYVDKAKKEREENSPFISLKEAVVREELLTFFELNMGRGYTKYFPWFH